jgi:FKBP-type peptidyl-prolyl cis-trans isomerase (trigger factor)
MPKKSDTTFTTKLVENVKNTAIVEVSIPTTLVAKERQHAVKHLAADVTLKGFRKGKAPLDLVEKELDPQKLVEHTLNHLLPEAVESALKTHNLKPIALPSVSIKSIETDKDWVVSLIFPLLPEFELGEYQSKLKDSLGSKLWTPDQGTPDKKEETPEEKLPKLFDALLSLYQFDVPQSLIEDEVNQSLTRLLQQTQSLGLTIEDYLKSIGKAPEQLRSEYEKAAADNLRLEFILAKIGEDMKLSASDTEIDQLVNASGDETLKKRFENPRERQYVASIVTKRKTIDALLKL